jgi:hypothetical protein
MDIWIPGIWHPTIVILQFVLGSCDTLPCIVGEEHELKVFKIKGLRKIHEPSRDAEENIYE